MNLFKARVMQNKMPWKQIYLDTVYNCYRLINPDELYEYKDDEGKRHIRLDSVALRAI